MIGGVDALKTMSIYRPTGFFQFENLRPKQTIFDCRIERILSNAEVVALDILNQNCNHTEKDCKMPRFKMRKSYEELFWYIVNATLLACGAKNSRDNEIRAIAGIAFGLLGLAASYYIGRDLALRRESMDELLRVYDDETAILLHYKELNDDTNPHAVIIRDIIKVQRKIFFRMKRNSEMEILIKVGLIASSIFGGIGLAMSVTNLLILGSCLGTISAGWWIARSSWNWTDHEDRRDASRLNVYVNELRTADLHDVKKNKTSK